MEDGNLSIESTSLKECHERVLRSPGSTLQFKSNDGQEETISSFSSTHSSLLVGNFQTLKINLKEMMNNLSEITNFLNTEEINVKKEKPAFIQHPSDVCDASKSDEMKLNEILNLLHHLTRTLTAYEKSPLLAELPSTNDANNEVEVNVQVPDLSEESSKRNEVLPNNLIETKTLRNEIDGIIQRKEALDDKIESFRKTATGNCQPSGLQKRRKSSVPIPDSRKLSGTTLYSRKDLDDLKKQDELLGLSDGGLSSEINSLGETIQHLLDENRNFRSFFDTIISHNQISNHQNGKKNPKYLLNEIVSQAIKPKRHSSTERPQSCFKTTHNYNLVQSSSRHPAKVHQCKFGSSPPFNSTFKEKPIENVQCVPLSNSKGDLIKLLPRRYNSSDESPLDLRHLSNRNLLTNYSHLPISDQNLDLHHFPLIGSSQFTADIEVNSQNLYNITENDVKYNKKRIDIVRGKCDARHQTNSTEPNSFQSDSNRLSIVTDVPHGANNDAENLVQLHDIEEKTNFLMREALTLKELLETEKSNLSDENYGKKFLIELPKREIFFNSVNRLKDISCDIYSNALQKKDLQCGNKKCHYQIRSLKKQNQLLQNQLALQIGLTSLIVSRSSRADEFSPKFNSNSQSKTSQCEQKKFTELSHEENNYRRASEGSVLKETAYGSQPSINISPNGRIAELQKLLIEESLKGQMWFAAEKATAMRLGDVEECLRKVKQSRRELQAKYNNLRQSRKSLRRSNTEFTARSEKNYEIMLTTLGRNIGIAAEILSSHVYFSQCAKVHPSPELTEDPSFWFAAQCSRLRWLQAQLRQLCIDNWKNTAEPTELNYEEDEIFNNDTLTRQHHCSSEPTLEGIDSNRFAATQKRRLSLPDYSHGADHKLFPFGSWSHLNCFDDRQMSKTVAKPLLKKTQIGLFIQECIHINEKNSETVESEFSNSTFDGISEISASINQDRP